MTKKKIPSRAKNLSTKKLGKMKLDEFIEMFEKTPDYQKMKIFERLEGMIREFVREELAKLKIKSA